MGSLDIATDRAMSKSYVAVQPEAIKATIKADIAEIVQRGDDKQWIDKDKGLFGYPYTTLVVVFQRKWEGGNTRARDRNLLGSMFIPAIVQFKSYISGIPLSVKFVYATPPSKIHQITWNQVQSDHI